MSKDKITAKILKPGQTYRIPNSKILFEIKELDKFKDTITIINSKDKKSKSQKLTIKDFIEMVNKADQSPDKKPEKTIRQTSMSLALKINEEDFRAYSKELGNLHKLRAEKEDAKRAYVKQIGGEMSEIDSKIGVLSNKVSSGEEYKDVAVEIHFHWVKNEKVVIIKTTGKVHKITAIPVSEIQMHMDDKTV